MVREEDSKWLFSGTERFSCDIHQMLGFYPGIYWRVCWKYVAPVFLLLIVASGLWDYKPLTHQEYSYPAWADGLGWLIAASSFSCIPLVALFLLLTTPGPLRQVFSLPIVFVFRVRPNQSTRTDPFVSPAEVEDPHDTLEGSSSERRGREGDSDHGEQHGARGRPRVNSPSPSSLWHSRNEHGRSTFLPSVNFHVASLRSGRDGAPCVRLGRVARIPVVASLRFLAFSDPTSRAHRTIDPTISGSVVRALGRETSLFRRRNGDRANKEDLGIPCSSSFVTRTGHTGTFPRIPIPHSRFAEKGPRRGTRLRSRRHGSQAIEELPDRRLGTSSRFLNPFGLELLVVA
ncbi:unnamed protein product [Darwinula stevensoni]|uniref:Uncharacterized protein n=1 Tax=Darwinula stevensoni TaxID=69355 RepID=A0A7R9AI94_9CRUS|nr:unnamed protein product [Darwinula stevensoni]CAG0905923.1 unnamed protein product [Darwinula stevensoni]